MTALNYTWTRSANFGTDCLTSPLEGTLRFLGISKTRRVPCSSVTARKCCLAAHKAKPEKDAIYYASAKNNKNYSNVLWKLLYFFSVFMLGHVWYSLSIFSSFLSNLYKNLTSIYCQRLLLKEGNNLRKATQGLMHVILAFVMCSWTNAASLVFSSRFHTSILPSSFPM